MPLTASQRQTLIWATVAALLLWALAALGPVLTPFVASAILAYVLEPGVEWLVRRRCPRTIAVVAVMLIAMAAMAAILLILVPILQSEFTQIRLRMPALASAITERLLPWARERLGLDLRIDAQAIRNWLAQHLETSGSDLASAIFDYVKSGWSAAAEVLGLLFLVPVVTFYLLADWPQLTSRIRELVPPRWQATALSGLDEIDTLLGHYLRGQLLVMIALAAWYAAALLVAGFELWLPIGVLSGLLVAIPYLGFAIGLVFALVTGMLQLGPLAGLVAVGVVYGLGQLLESLVLTPKLVGDRIGLHPVAVILALLAFGALLGFIGVLLALPMSAVVAVALRRLRKAYLDSDFYNSP